MRYDPIATEYTIRGSCLLFACRCCYTKYGWEHQKWCEVCLLTLPGCLDCLYYREQRRSCIHPAKRKRKEDLPHEKAKRPI